MKRKSVKTVARRVKSKSKPKAKAKAAPRKQAASPDQLIQALCGYGGLADVLRKLVDQAEQHGRRDEPEIMKARDLLNKSTKI